MLSSTSTITTLSYHPFINPIENPADILPVNGIPKLVIANEEAIATAILYNHTKQKKQETHRTHNRSVAETFLKSLTELYGRHRYTQMVEHGILKLAIL